VYAINESLDVLSWFENLPDDEQPPRSIWWSEALQAEWFRNVKENRKNKHSRGGKKRSSYEQAQDVPMMQNEMIDRSGPVPVVKHE
jgi:hypothetical protein